MWTMRYVGENEILQGEIALVRPSMDPDIVWAQFDNETLKIMMGEGWHTFMADDFEKVE